ncbi:hypothetical protein BWI15_30285 [Kribbella sp. ALI-6-A]|uniref:SRPBCC domain-containing protein n=1 Tax=Kribbella sp. ALI-6-A TaxID=1933817 RepID=UPI00097BBFEF|nr:SRPBCC domain-containing protein [Kribbella sp. ALI-6-A]ONI67422.1 hypothetical protein BWI15_30285 [Kribbella sp. ALI-6-A]
MPDLDLVLGSTARSITRMPTTDHDTRSGGSAPADTYSVVLRRSYDADIQDVWSAWTTPSRLSRWLGDLTGTPQVGGVVQLTMSPPDQDVATLHITACVPPTQVRARWTWPDEPDSTVELLLEPTGTTTELTLTHSRTTAATAVQYGYGWEDFLNRLTELLAGRDPAAISWADAQLHLQPLWTELLEKA